MTVIDNCIKLFTLLRYTSRIRRENMRDELEKQLTEYIELNKEKYIEWLVDFCKIPSVAAQNRGMTEAVDYLKELFTEKLAISPEVLETSGYPVVFAHLKGESDEILSFYNHYDVQPEDPVELWETPAFEPNIRDGKIYARGVADNKGNLVARVAAIHAIQQVIGKLPIDIKFILEGEEEIGSVHLEEFTEKYPEKIKADANIWEFGYRDADGTIQVSLGVKGMLYIELVAKGANTDLHSAQASIIKSPAWRLIWALNCIKGPDDKVKIKGFYDDMESITEKEKALLDSYKLNEEDFLNKLEIPEFIQGLTGDKLKQKHIYEPTCNICGIVSGYTGEGQKTVLPNEARAKIDFRLVPGQDPDKILSLLREHLDSNGFSDIEIIVKSTETAARTNPSEKIVESILDVTERYTKRKPNVVPNTPGTGPMYVLCQKFGIPSASFGVGHFASNNHAPNENINVEDYIEGVKMIAALVLKFSEKKQGVSL